MSSVLLLTDLIESFEISIQPWPSMNALATGCESITKCPSRKRVTYAMQFYRSLNIEQNSILQDKWLTFMEKSHTGLLDDYIHLIKNHNDELESMQSVCNEPNCQPLIRHYRSSTAIDINSDSNDDKKYSLYRNLMDSIHCYLCHSYDVGLRKSSSSSRSTTTQPRAHLDPLVNQRFTSGNKFSLQTNASDMDEQPRYNDVTYMDAMLDYAKQHCLSSQQVDALQDYVVSEQYDTDAIIHDFEHEILNIERLLNDAVHSTKDEQTQSLKQQAEATCVCGALLAVQSADDCYGESYVECDLCGNTLIAVDEPIVYHCPKEYDTAHPQGFDICLSCAQKQFFSRPETAQTNFSDLLREYVRCSQLSSNSFSIGYRFYYWDYHTSQEAIVRQKSAADQDSPENIFDHGGYTMQELHIQPKYECIKDEILNNRFCRLQLNQFRVSLDKAMEYVLSNYAKQIKARGHLCEEYGIDKDDTITVDHLLSVILYTDWTDLCTAFSRTFRKLKPYQNILSIKENNREFAHWARLLRETVEIFGENGRDYTFKNNECVYTAVGPFYCGISSKMVVPYFNIRLCAPTSTSKQREVAEMFAGAGGMVIELDNRISTTSRNLMLFNSSWKSNHSAEDERLMFGGAFPIRIANIRNTQTRYEYRKFIEPLYQFHCLLNGTRILQYAGDAAADKEYKIIDKLIRHYLNTDGYRNKYDAYVNDMFAAFVNAQTQIVLNLNVLHIRFYYKIWDHLVEQQQQGELDRIHENVLRLFKHTKELMIYSNERKFNLSDLLLSVQCIVTTRSKKHEFRIIVQSEAAKTAYYPNERSWLFSQYEILRKQQTFKNFSMDFVHESKSIEQYVDRLIICC